MLERINYFIGWLSKWQRYCAILVLLFIIRGVFVLTVLPPFEGWDEYQHIAYIAFLAEHDRPPVLHEDYVPRSLYPDLVKYPHAPLAVEQLRGIGAKSYGEFWKNPTAGVVPENSGKLPLYQAQHSSLYYRLVAQLFAWIRRAEGLRSTITVLRFLNLSFGAAAIGITLFVVGRIITPSPQRYLLGLLVALQPLFLVNCLRVANDALAILLGTAAIAILLTLSERRWHWAAFCGGATLGLGILAKTINLCLVPPVILLFLWLAWRKKINWKQALGAEVSLIATTGAICFAYFSFNISHFGMLVPMQEAVVNRAQGKTSADLIQAGGEIHWWREISRRYLRHSLWRGGWSFLPPAKPLARTQEYLIYIASAGYLFLLLRRFRQTRPVFQEGNAPLFISVMMLSITLSLAFHMLHTYVALGSVATNIWYAAVCFPWMLYLFYRGLMAYPMRWVATSGLLVLIAVYANQEVYGTMWNMVTAYAGCGWGPLARERLAILHPSWLGPDLTIPMLLLVGMLIAIALAIWNWVRDASRNPVDVGAILRRTTLLRRV